MHVQYMYKSISLTIPSPKFLSLRHASVVVTASASHCCRVGGLWPTICAFVRNVSDACVGRGNFALLMAWIVSRCGRDREERHLQPVYVRYQVLFQGCHLVTELSKGFDEIASILGGMMDLPVFNHTLNRVRRKVT